MTEGGSSVNRDYLKGGGGDEVLVGVMEQGFYVHLVCGGVQYMGRCG